MVGTIDRERQAAKLLRSCVFWAYGAKCRFTASVNGRPWPGRKRVHCPRIRKWRTIVYAQPHRAFSEEEQVALTLCAVEIDDWDRFAAPLRPVPGS